MVVKMLIILAGGNCFGLKISGVWIVYFTDNISLGTFQYNSNNWVGKLFFLLNFGRFHPELSIWRKIQFVGLCTTFKNKSEIGKFLNIFFGLSFLRPHEVHKCFYEDLMAIRPNDQRIDNF